MTSFPSHFLLTIHNTTTNLCDTHQLSFFHRIILGSTGRRVPPMDSLWMIEKGACSFRGGELQVILNLEICTGIIPIIGHSYYVMLPSDWLVLESHDHYFLSCQCAFFCFMLYISWRYDYMDYCTDVSKFPTPRFASEFGFQSYSSFRAMSGISVSDVSQ